jgi:hypothetical protein
MVDASSVKRKQVVKSKEQHICHILHSVRWDAGEIITAVGNSDTLKGSRTQ